VEPHSPISPAPARTTGGLGAPVPEPWPGLEGGDVGEEPPHCETATADAVNTPAQRNRAEGFIFPSWVSPGDERTYCLTRTSLPWRALAILRARRSAVAAQISSSIPPTRKKPRRKTVCACPHGLLWRVRLLRCLLGGDRPCHGEGYRHGKCQSARRGATRIGSHERSGRARQFEDFGKPAFALTSRICAR
jgi:hypothetical protein